MLSRSLTLVLVASSCLAGCWADESDHGSAGLDLDEKTFKLKVEEKPHFIMFFAPWCGHCKRLAPTWQSLAKKHNSGEQKIVVGKVDCTIETALCSDQDVTGYPTLKFYKEGTKSGVKFRGERDLDALNKFIDDQMQSSTSSKDEKLVEVPSLEDGLFILNEHTFDKHIENGEHFIKFYAPWCGHCKKLAPTWASLAKAVHEEKSLSIKIAKIDCTEAKALCQSHGVHGYPTLSYFKNGQLVENYSGGRTLKDLRDYVSSLAEDYKTDKGKEEEVKSHVLKLEVDNFKEKIKSGVTFVKFFAPWCGHCKRLAPTWEELAVKLSQDKLMDNVKVAHVDCTSNDNVNKQLCNEQGVNGFPTLIIYKDGVKAAEYTGKRDLDKLVEFVKGHSPEKDEL